MKATKSVSYALLRLTMGINLMGHGLVRFAKWAAFRDGVVEIFSDSLLPSGLVYLWASALPALEFTLGMLLLTGLFTRQAAVGGALLIAVLVFGSCLVEQWEWVGLQMVYALCFYVLISKVDHDDFAVDRMFRSASKKEAD